MFFVIRLKNVSYTCKDESCSLYKSTATMLNSECCKDAKVSTVSKSIILTIYMQNDRGERHAYIWTPGSIADFSTRQWNLAHYVRLVLMIPTIYEIPRLVQFGLNYSARSASAVAPFFTLGDGASNEGRRANQNQKSPLAPLSSIAFPMPASPVVPRGQVGSDLRTQT